LCEKAKKITTYTSVRMTNTRSRFPQLNHSYAFCIYPTIAVGEKETCVLRLCGSVCQASSPAHNTDECESGQYTQPVFTAESSTVAVGRERDVCVPALRFRLPSFGLRLHTTQTSVSASLTTAQHQQQQQQQTTTNNNSWLGWCQKTPMGGVH
jgi:hypothetical protein